MKLDVESVVNHLPAARMLQPIFMLLSCHVMFHVKQMLLHRLQH